MLSLVKIRNFAALSLLLVFSGCGYTLSHRLKESFKDSRGIFVPVFDNQTDETGAERIFTNALIHELESRGEVLLSSRQAGGLELRGAVATLGYGPTAFTDTGFLGLQTFRRIPTEIGVNVQINLVLLDPEKKTTIWSKTFTGFRRVQAPTTRTYDYQAPSSIGLITQSIVESTYPDIARDIMRDVYDEMVELF